MFNANLQEAIQAEKKAEQVRIAFVDALCEKIRKATPGVKTTRISDSPVTFSVPFSQLASEGRFNLTPEYYSQDAQADLVKSALKSASSMTSTVKKIEEISTAKAVISVNGGFKKRFALNGVTCNILQDAIKGAVL